MKQLLSVDPALAALISDVARQLPDVEVIVIGGQVLACYPFFHRETEDLDICVLVADERIRNVLSPSPDWKHTGLPVRWVHVATDGLVDIVAAPPGDESPLVLSGGREFSRVGMGRLDEVAHDVQGLPSNVRFAPVAAIALLKMVAWLDRPHERKKDLDDIRVILEHYEDEEFEIEDDTRRTDRLVDAWRARTDLEFNLAEMGAWLLGQDMARFATQAAQQAVRAFVELNSQAPDDALDPEDPFVVLLPCMLRGFEDA